MERKELIMDVIYEFINLNKELNAETIKDVLNDNKIPKSTKIKLLVLMDLPTNMDINKIMKFPEIKKKIEEKAMELEEESKDILKSDNFEIELLKRYLEKIEDLLVGQNLEKEYRKTGVKEKKIPFVYSKKFDIKETIKSFIKKEYKFYSKLSKDYKKGDIVLLLDFSSSMKGEKIEDLKKFVTFLFLNEKRKIKDIFIFRNDVKKVSDLIEILKEKPKGDTDISKALKEVSKYEKDSIIYLITDNIPTRGTEKEIIRAVKELQSKNNKLIIILLKPEKRSIELAQKMSDKVLVLEGNYFRSLIDLI